MIAYRTADRALVKAMPELAAPHARFLADHPDHVEDPLQYLVVGDVFAPFIEILLAMPASPARDVLLRRDFAFLEEMLRSDDTSVGDLGAIAILEGRPAWWLARALPFLGPAAIEYLDAARPRWRGEATIEAYPDAEREIIDLYGVREAIATALRDEDVNLVSIPGITSPAAWMRYPSLAEAREDAEGVVFLSCFGTSQPYVLCPARLVRCDESVLRDLAHDLATVEGQEPNQQEKAQSAYFRIVPGERVWNVHTVESRHGRYRGTPWIHPALRARGLASAIEKVLSCRQRRLQDENTDQRDESSGF